MSSIDRENSKSDPCQTLNPEILRLWKKAGRGIKIKVTGFSMYPIIRTGDTVSLKLMDGQDLKTGDLITFWENQKLVVHRLIKKQKQNHKWIFCEKGDNAITLSWVNGDQVVGKAIRIQGQDRTIDLTKTSWRCFNALFGKTISAWILMMGGMNPNDTFPKPKLFNKIYQRFAGLFLKRRS